MERYFNTVGVCVPQRHYMVDIRGRLRQIKRMVDAGAYFTVNRARQYGKTTMLTALRKYLESDRNGILTIANRLFETRIYNYFLSFWEEQNSKIYEAASNNKTE